MAIFAAIEWNILNITYVKWRHDSKIICRKNGRLI
jgi:hypothetical protein